MEDCAPHIGLVLSGGGARAAYQAGSLKAISDILAKVPARAKESPFRSIAGISGGAINAAFVGCNADDFAGAASDSA